MASDDGAFVSAPLTLDAGALLTDLYELTMAAGYWKLGRLDDQAIFTLFFRHAPFGGGFTLAAGLEGVVAFIEHYRFSPPELEHLAGLVGNDDRPLFEPAFLDYLGDLRLTVDVDAMPEGTLAFPHEPLLRVTGPLLQGQLLESALLNLVNYPTLAATKAAHVVFAAGGAPVMEFGLRRAQGPDGGLTASRAAYLGGCSGTSNVLAGRLFGIPVRGTHAHSWILSFADETTADLWAERNSKAARRVPRDLRPVVHRKLTMLDSAQRLDDLAAVPGNRLEALTGDRKGQHSIRVNQQYRITFRWEGHNAHDVCCEDYH